MHWKALHPIFKQACLNLPQIKINASDSERYQLDGLRQVLVIH